MEETQPKVSVVEFNVDFLRTPHGFLRILEAIFGLSQIISGSVGSHCLYREPFGFSIFVAAFALVEAIIVILIYTLQLHTKITQINLPLTFLINDSITCLFYLIGSICIMLAIGACSIGVTARVFAALFSIANFLVLIGLVYLAYNMWNEQQEKNKTEVPKEITLTHSSATVIA